MGIRNVLRLINKPINTPLSSPLIIATVLSSCLLNIYYAQVLHWEFHKRGQ